MYDTTWWAWLVTVWEVVVYNSVLDLQQCWQVGTPGSCAMWQGALIIFRPVKYAAQSLRRNRISHCCLAPLQLRFASPLLRVARHKQPRVIAMCEGVLACHTFCFLADDEPQS